jgi:hypothetical protein
VGSTHGLDVMTSLTFLLGRLIGGTVVTKLPKPRDYKLRSLEIRKDCAHLGLPLRSCEDWHEGHQQRILSEP